MRGAHALEGQPWSHNAQWALYVSGRGVLTFCSEKALACFLCRLFSGRCQYIAGHIPSKWRGKDLEGSGRGLIEVLSRHLPGETEVPAENRTEHLHNMSP
jgi:hypothetical protein